MSRGRPPSPAGPSSRRMDLAGTALIRAPPCSCHASMKQGPFAPDGLCCPADQHYYDPLRLPLGSPPLPGSAGYRRATLPNRASGAEEALSSSQDNLPTIPRSLRREVLRRPLQVPGRLPWPSPNHHGLGTSLVRPAGRAGIDDAASFTSCCGLVGCTPPKDACHSTSTPPSRTTPGVSYRGSWRLPGPDLHRLAVLSLTSGYICSHPFWVAMMPGLLDVR